MDAAIIGAGPSGLMAAEVLAQGGARVTVYDAMTQQLNDVIPMFWQRTSRLPSRLAR